MKLKTAGILALSVTALAGLLALRLSGDPLSRMLSDLESFSSPPLPEVADAIPEVADSIPQDTVATEAAPMQDFAADCFRTLRERNPRGRILRLTANRLADRCSIIIETDAGSDRWLFDWRDYTNGYVHEGELRWPQSWPDERPSAGIDDAEFAPGQLAALMEEARSVWPEDQRRDWLYEIIWLPQPFARPLVFISFDDLSEGAADDSALTVIFDGSARLADDDYEQAHALYPLTRFELREDHNFKGPLYESTALAEAPVSLEGDPDAGAPGPLAAMTEHCMHWLHGVNTGRRVLRVGIDAVSCYLVLENSGVRDDYYLLSAHGSEEYIEHASLILEPLPTSNLLLDRSRLSAARVRERLQQAGDLGGAGYAIERVAMAWVDGAMIWQFDGTRDGRQEVVYMDESGGAIAAPASYPVSSHERATGFPDTLPVLPFIAEAR